MSPFEVFVMIVVLTIGGLFYGLCLGMIATAIYLKKLKVVE